MGQGSPSYPAGWHLNSIAKYVCTNTQLDFVFIHKKVQLLFKTNSLLPWYCGVSNLLMCEGGKSFYWFWICWVLIYLSNVWHRKTEELDFAFFACPTSYCPEPSKTFQTSLFSNFHGGIFPYTKLCVAAFFKTYSPSEAIFWEGGVTCNKHIQESTTKLTHAGSIFCISPHLIPHVPWHLVYFYL